MLATQYAASQSFPPDIPLPKEEEEEEEEIFFVKRGARLDFDRLFCEDFLSKTQSPEILSWMLNVFIQLKLKEATSHE